MEENRAEILKPTEGNWKLRTATWRSSPPTEQ